MLLAESNEDVASWPAGITLSVAPLPIILPVPSPEKEKEPEKVVEEQPEVDEVLGIFTFSMRFSLAKLQYL